MPENKPTPEVEELLDKLVALLVPESKGKSVEVHTTVQVHDEPSVTDELTDELDALMAAPLSAESLHRAAVLLEKLAPILEAQQEASEPLPPEKQKVRLSLHNGNVLEIANANEFAKGLIGTPATDSEGNQNGHISDARYTPGKGVEIEITSVIGGVRRVHDCLLYRERDEG